MQRPRLSLIPVLSVFLFSSSVFAAESGKTDRASMSELDASTPKKACESIVQATKKGDFASIRQLSASPLGQTPEKARKGFDQMRQHNMAQLKDLECGSEQKAGSRAMVVAKTKGDERLIPFIQVGSVWKFDAQTYMSFYPDHGNKDSVHQKSAGAE